MADPGVAPATTSSAAAAVERWLIAEGRLLADPAALVDGLARRLVDLGVPLLRARSGQALANPLLIGWGVIWRRGSAVEIYQIPRTNLDTASWRGSPFERVMDRREIVRQRPTALTVADHPAFHDQAAEGATDYLALPAPLR